MQHFHGGNALPVQLLLLSFQERDQEIEALSTALDKRKESESAPESVPCVDIEGPRRSQRLMTHAEQGRVHVELEQCRADLLAKTQGIYGD